MDREAIERDVKRLAEVVGSYAGDNDTAEAVGLAIGLAGLAVTALVRIADALEQRA